MYYYEKGWDDQWCKSEYTTLKTTCPGEFSDVSGEYKPRCYKGITYPNYCYLLSINNFPLEWENEGSGFTTAFPCYDSEPINTNGQAPNYGGGYGYGANGYGQAPSYGYGFGK